MMQPIRWNNVETPGLGAPAQTLESAARLLSGAFSSFQKPMDQANATEEANWQQGKTNNLADLRMQIMKYGNAADLKAAQQNGTLDALYKSYGGQIDKGAAADFMDQRLPTLQARDVQVIQYKNTMTKDSQRALYDQIKMLAQSTNPDDRARAQGMLNDHTELMDRAELASNIIDSAYRDVTRDREGKNFDLNQRKGNAEITHMGAQDANAAAMLRLQRDQFGLQKQQFAMTAEDRLANQVAATRGEAAKYAAMSPNSEQGIEKIGTFIKNTFKSEDQQNLAHDVVSDLRAQYPKATTSDIQNILNGMSNTGFFKNWSLYYSQADIRADALKRAKSIVGSPESTENAQRNETNYGSAATEAAAAQQRLNDFRTQMRKSGGNPFTAPPNIQKQIEAAAAKGAASQTGADPLDSPATPAAAASTPPPVIEPPPVRSTADLKTQAAKEKLEMANGTRMRYSPDVDTYVKQEYQQSAKARDEARKKELESELQRELRKSRGYANN